MDNDELQQPNGNGAAAAAIAIDASAVVRKHGMNSAENKVYLKLLEGDTNVMDICARIGMKYGSVYAALGNLSNDGIVGRRGTGRFTYYLTPESKPGLPGAPVDASGRDVTGPSAEASGTDATTIIDAPTVVEKYVEAAATSGLTDAEKQLIGTYGLNDRDIAAYEALLKHGGDGARSDVLARDLNINADIAKARMKKPVEAGLARLDRSYFAITPRGFFASEAAKNRTMLKSANDELRETSRKLDNARLEIFNDHEINRVLTKTTEANARTIEAFKRSKTVPAEAKPERTAADKMVESLYESALRGLSHTAADVYRALAGVNGAIDKKQVASLLPDVNDFKVNLALDGELVKMGLARKDGEAYSAMPLADVLIAPLVERAKKAEAERNGAVSERNAATEKLERMSKAGGFGKAELEYMASAGINTIGIEAYRSLLDDGPASVKELSERMHTDSGMFVTQLDGLRKAGLASYNSGRLGPVRVGELMWTELRRSREALKAKDAEPVIAAARPDDIAKPKDGGTAALEPARQREEPDETSSPAEKFSDNEIKYMSGKGVHRDARATYRSLVKRGSIDTSGMEEGRAQAGHLRALEAAGLAMSSGGVYSPKTLTDALYGDLQLAASMSRGRAASIEPLVMMITGGEAGRVLENLKVDKETRTVYRALLAAAKQVDADHLSVFIEGMDAAVVGGYLEKLAGKGLAKKESGLYMAVSMTEVMGRMLKKSEDKFADIASMLSDMRAGKAPTYEPKEDNIEGEEAEEENEAAPAPSPAPAIEEPKATPVEHEPMPRERSRETTPRLLGGGYVEQRQIPIDRIRPLPERKEGSKNTFAASSPWDNPDSRLFNAYVELCDWNKKEFNDPVVGRKRDAIFNASESILSSLVANGGEQKYILLLENAVYDTVGELVKMYKSGKSLDDSMNIYIEKLGGLAEGLPKLDIGELIRKSYKGAA